MLTQYIQQAMRHANYELTENDRVFGRIPECKGLWAEAKTLEECREKLQSTLEDWLLLGLQMGHLLPVPPDGFPVHPDRRAKEGGDPEAE